ncbi:MAG: outer membrane lipoprotein carrier protein LolA [Polyangia bacterium]
MTRLGAIACSLVLLVPYRLVAADEELPDGGPDDAGAALDPALRWLESARECLDGAFSFEADFTQELIHPLGNPTGPMRGRVQLRRGDRLRLDYRKPRRRLVVSDGEIVRAWDPENRTVIETRSARSPIHAAFRFALAAGGSDDFTARLLGGPGDPARGGPAVLELIPLRESPLVERVLVTLVPDCPPVRRVVLIDRAGCAVRITFFEARLDAGIGHRRFVFEPPPGARVVRP